MMNHSIIAGIGLIIFGCFLMSVGILNLIIWQYWNLGWYASGTLVIIIGFVLILKYRRK